MAQARKLIAAIDGVSGIRSSFLYKTKPISDVPQDDYYNAVIECQVRLEVSDFLSQLQRIEKLLGKVDKPKDAPRLLDLDILLFGETVMESQPITIPHSRMLKRAFVLIPLLDLIPSGVIAFPTFDGKVMIQLRDKIQEVQKDPNQQVVRATGSIWDQEV